MRKDVASVCQGGMFALCTSGGSFLKINEKSNHGFPQCPEVKSEMLGWSEHFGGGLSPIPTGSGAAVGLSQLPSTETLPGGAQRQSPSDQLRSFSPVTPAE